MVKYTQTQYTCQQALYLVEFYICSTGIALFQERLINIKMLSMLTSQSFKMVFVADKQVLK